MIFLLRIFLIGLIIYLIFRSFYIYGEDNSKRDNAPPKPPQPEKKPVKKISKDVGEFIDYEEVK
jgi:hypothetical protein